MKSLLIILLIFEPFLVLRAQEPGLDAQGEAAFKAGGLNEAEELFSQAIQANPRDARAYYDRAFAECSARDFDKAQADCTAALKLSPSYAKVYCILGNINWVKGQREDAANDFDEALNLDPNDYGNWYNRGMFYLHNEDDRAITDMGEVIRLAPRYDKAYYMRGDAYCDQQKYDEAIQDYTAAIGLNPGYGNLYHQRGFAYAKSGKLDEAIADFSKAIQLKPRSDVEYYVRGCAYTETHNYSQAIQDFSNAILISPKNGGYYNQRGQAYLQVGDKDRAAQDFNEASLLKTQGSN